MQGVVVRSLKVVGTMTTIDYQHLHISTNLSLVEIRAEQNSAWPEKTNQTGPKKNLGWFWQKSVWFSEGERSESSASINFGLKPNQTNTNCLDQNQGNLLPLYFNLLLILMPPSLLNIFVNPILFTFCHQGSPATTLVTQTSNLHNFYNSVIGSKIVPSTVFPWRHPQEQP